MILVDMHPASVQLPDGSSHQHVRVTLTHQRLRVWREVGRRPELVLDTAHDGVTLETRYPLIGRAMTWPTAAGDVVVTRMGGCGCGSSLKAVQPPRDDTAD